MPTMSAVGVASPMAHGQAMTSTLTADKTACGSMAFPPMMSHSAKVSSEMATTVGTKTRAMRSTTRCTGAFEPCASCTMRIMFERTVFWPTSSAFMCSVPCLTMVPASTLSPWCFSTAAASPVIMLSSMVTAVASHTLPSTGIFSPGRTSSTSRGWTAAMGMSTAAPSSVMQWAVFGCRPISERMLPAVPCLARSSRRRPVSTKVMIITEASK